MRRRRLWIAVPALLGLALLAGRWMERQGGGALAHADGESAPATLPRAAQAGASSAAGPLAAASPAGPAQAASGIETGAAALSPRALRMRSDWCGYGAIELEKDEEAGRGLSREQMAGLDGMRVLREAQREVRARWVRQLKARGDQRSLAIAAFLDEAFPTLPKEDPGSRARLQDLARRSTDPLVTVLALHRPCPPGACTNIEPSQWSRLEPDNVLAWLAQWKRERQEQAEQAQQGLLAERIAQIAAQARHADSQLQDLAALLRALPVEGRLGLTHQAESMLLYDFRADQGPADLLDLTLACRDAGTQPGVRKDCLTIAERLWQQEELGTRWAAVGIGRIVDPGSELWRSRSLMHKAVSYAHMDSSRQQMEVLKDIPPRQLCPSLPALRSWTMALFRGDEWQQGEAIIRASGLDARAWLLRWHDAHPDVDRPTELGPAPAASP